MSLRPFSTRSGTGAQPGKPRLGERLRAWRENHRLVAGNSFARLLEQPFANTLTIAVLAVALALPAGFYLVAQNLHQLSGKVGDSIQMNIYLQQSVSTQDVQALRSELSSWPEVASTRYISASEALTEFRASTGYSEVLDALPDNPLPDTLVVNLGDTAMAIADAEQLRARAAALDAVALAQLDIEWLQRAQSLIALVDRLTYWLGALLATGVVLVIGNTIRVAIDSRRDEIAVTRLVGGTNAFIRRPFLYMGIWFGLAGALLASILLFVGMYALTTDIKPLISMVSADFKPSGLGIADVAQLLLAGAAMGWLGALLATSQQLSALNP